MNLASRNMGCSCENSIPVFLRYPRPFNLSTCPHVPRFSELTEIFLFFLIYFIVIDQAASAAVSPLISMD